MMRCKALTITGRRCKCKALINGYCVNHHTIRMKHPGLYGNNDYRRKVNPRKYKIMDLYRFVESLKFRPETYHTILLDKFDNKNTETNKVRKKISKFVKQGLMASGMLDGESGTKIFYSLEKQYYIFIVRVNGKYAHYYCSDVDDKFDEAGTIVLYNAFILKHFDWEYLGNIAVMKTDVQRWF